MKMSILESKYNVHVLSMVVKGDKTSELVCPTWVLLNVVCSLRNLRFPFQFLLQPSFHIVKIQDFDMNEIYYISVLYLVNVNFFYYR